jgi:glutamyl/glutaminyl-tRNA synthetase
VAGRQPERTVLTVASSPDTRPTPYRGRLAPSPTGYLHLGHARTFWIAQQRAAHHGGTLILRNEDIDRARCKPEFVSAMTEDLQWFGFEWQEGVEAAGGNGPYHQSQRYHLYRRALEKLKQTGLAYPCTCSRKDIQSAASAPQGADDEIIYPGTCRPGSALDRGSPPADACCWRFCVPDGERIEFTDLRMGRQSFEAGTDFGDFVLWRNDDVPAYHLAVVVDDDAMNITEVVRGEDLLVSTARQLLLYRALRLEPPDYCHCPLLTDAHGVRLAKRNDALSLRTLRQRGESPETLRARWPDIGISG